VSGIFRRQFPICLGGQIFVFPRVAARPAMAILLGWTFRDLVGQIDLLFIEVDFPVSGFRGGSATPIPARDLFFLGDNRLKNK
jgi:hypothetical protein